MSDCTTTTSICVYVSPCDSGIDTTLAADFTGTLNIYIEFNGTYSEVSLSVIEGANIILPNVLNADYIHHVKFVKPDGTLLNNSCYLFSVHGLNSTGDGLIPDPSSITRTCTIQVTIAETPDTGARYRLCNGDEIAAQYAPGTSLTIPHLVGKYVQLPVVVDNQPREEIPFDAATGTFTASFFDGSTITFQYEETI